MLLRAEKRFGNTAVVELTGLPRRTIQALEERGDCLVSNAKKIADVLGLKIDDFFEPPADNNQ